MSIGVHKTLNQAMQVCGGVLIDLILTRANPRKTPPSTEEEEEEEAGHFVIQLLISHFREDQAGSLRM